MPHILAEQQFAAKSIGCDLILNKAGQIPYAPTVQKELSYDNGDSLRQPVESGAF
jgi:hypothetical protein